MQSSILSAVAKRASSTFLHGSPRTAAPISARAIGALSSKSSSNSQIRFFASAEYSKTSASPDKTERPYYHIEVSNVARKDVTQIVVSGPGTLGLLASMCVTLATKGGSIKELYAANCLKEQGFTYDGPYIAKPIRDIITVVDYQTGKAFRDDQLEDLATAVLESTRSPMKVVQAVKEEMTNILDRKHNYEYDRGKITVVPSDRFRGL